MPLTLTSPPQARESLGEAQIGRGSVFVACPDARPPAYEAVVGLAKGGHLHGFLTGFYYGGRGPLTRLARQYVPCYLMRWRRVLKRRHHPGIPASKVRTVPSFDVALVVERRLGGKRFTTGGTEGHGGDSARLRVAQWRTRHFDRTLARTLERERPEALLVFSDVGSEFALPACRRLGIPSFLSMVHGDVREERRVLEIEAERAPEWFPLYLGDNPVDTGEMAWLHERRLCDLELADMVLVPSEYIAGVLESHGTPRERIRVIPYAADTRRFRPDPDKQHGKSCTFLFAGGISQRKGIGYLLQAWHKVRRPGWRLQLLGTMPREVGPMAGYLDGVECLGRVPHAEVPARMAAADVFVFPSLFEGSAVVTYEALACGLPSVVTPAAGSIVREGVEGFLVPERDIEALADRMERLGTDAALRSAMSRAARARAEAFDWPRYHAAVIEAVREAAGR